MKQTKTYLHNNYSYTYTLEERPSEENEEIVFFSCKGAGIHQAFVRSDFEEIFENLGYYIDLHTQHNKKALLKLRLTHSQKQKLEQASQKAGKTMTQFVLECLPREITHEN